MQIEMIHKVVAEMAEQIAGARIAKIHQPSSDMLLLRLWNGQQNLKLLISTDARQPRIHLTDQSFPNPFTPPRFCQLLRARLSRVLAVKQLNDDRIVELACQGAKGECRLIVELLGRSSNVLLLAADGKIIDVLKRQAGGRISPGATYEFPERLSREVGGGRQPVGGDLSASEAVEKAYNEQSAENISDLSVRLAKLISKQLKKLRRRIDNIEKEHARQQDFEHYRQLGDLLLSNLHQLKKGMAQIELENYYQQPPATESVPLDSLLTPQENAEKYYRKYKKARRGIEHSSRRIAETKSEQQWLEQLQYQLDGAKHPTDISLVADELKSSGLLKEKLHKLPRVQKAVSEFKEAQSPSGFKVLWGTNSRQNDQLSMRVMKKGDLWFHANRCPGSHVVLRQDHELGQFTDEDLGFAASIAAANSKSKLDSKVEVMVAEAKAVRKPPGAKLGMVTVANYKTLVVKPIAVETNVF